MGQRLILALTLSFLVIFGWSFLAQRMGWVEKPQPPKSTEEVSDTQPPAEPGTVVDEQATNETASQAEPSDTAATAEDSTDQEAPLVTQAEPTRVVLRSERLEAVIDNRGAVIDSAKLRDYYQSSSRKTKVELVYGIDYHPAEVLLDDGSYTRNAMFDVVESSNERAVFRHQNGDLSIEKTFTVVDGFMLRCDVAITRDGQPVSFTFVISEGLQPIGPNEKLTASLLDFGAMNPKIMFYVYDRNGKHKDRQPKKKDAVGFSPLMESDDWIRWAGVRDNYFAAVYMPDEAQNNVLANATTLTRGEKENLLPVSAFAGKGQLAGQFYFGPMDPDTLASADPRLETLISYGWAGQLSKWLFIGLDAIHGITGNWGWAIVFLTLLIRLLLFPLMIPSLKSSVKMRAIQPKMEALKRKYKGDDLEAKQKMAQETMKLYKEEGVNPFSSCITGLVQMPIFFAYFSLLRSSIALRQTDWQFWIVDLSSKDPYFILPIIMGATMYFSMNAMPMPSTDPMQQRIMKIMPVMFSLMFFGMPAGLVLYMITSNIFTLVQTLVVKWRMQKV